jgi:hypothetical protein
MKIKDMDLLLFQLRQRCGKGVGSNERTFVCEPVKDRIVFPKELKDRGGKVKVRLVVLSCMFEDGYKRKSCQYKRTTPQRVINPNPNPHLNSNTNTNPNSNTNPKM